MSALEERVDMDDLDAIPVSGGSLADRIAARERELAKQPEHSILLPVPGMEGILSAQYRALSYREAFKIEARHERNKDEADKLLLVAADKLISACEQIVEDDGGDAVKPTGYKWGTVAARDLFRRELPDNATARQALLAIFPDEEAVIRHAADLEEQRQELRKRLDKELEGESVAGSTPRV